MHILFLNSAGLTSKSPLTELQLIFEDTFDNGFDKSKWKNEISAFGGGNWEFQIYSPEPTNTFVRNGVLHLKPTTTADKFGENFLHHGILDMRREWGYCTKSEFYGCLRNSKDAMIPPIMSSKVISKVSFKYGRVEVVAQMPIGDWIWPAIWLMPKEEHYGGWPMSGEIDMVEVRCNKHFGDIGIQRMMSTLHWGPHSYSYQVNIISSRLANGNWSDKMHKYTMDWNEYHIILSVDDEPVLTADTPQYGYWGLGGFSGNNLWSNGSRDAPFDREFYLQMNTAVGGTNGFFPDGVQNAGYNKPWSNNDPKASEKFWNARNLWMPTWHGDDSALKIDSVRIWKKI
ncbi:beta-1,3-glucan-binding protein-like [Mytilus trossulus]|uniref:beta-1,3-glucan-binding protein-like n=1 Tax=Mytilus trossulus TaxID=6551 RepID=UPI003007CA55